MPELMELKLLVLVRRWHRTTPNIKNTYRKERYIDRHKAREDWTKTGAKSAGFYSRWITWNKPALKESSDDIGKRFKNMNVKMK